MANIYAMQKRKLQNNIEGNLKDKELFGPVFSDYAQSLVEMLVGRGYVVHVCYDKSVSHIGFTDGRDIYINAGHPMLSFYKKQEMRFNSVLGVLFHECGHCNDPTLLRSFQSILEQIDKNIPFIDERDDFSDEEQEVYDALSDKAAAPIILSICKEVMNVGLDAHDEAMMTNNFNAMVGYCLMIALGIQEASTPRLDQLREKKADEFDIVMSLVFQFIRFGKYIMKDTDESWDDSAVKKVVSMAKDLDVMRTSDKPSERTASTFNILVSLWPLVKDKLNQANNQQSGSGNQNGQSGQSGQSGQNSQNGQPGQPGSSPFTQSGVSSVVTAVQKESSGLTSQTPTNPVNGKTKLSAIPQNKAGQNSGNGQGTTNGQAASSGQSASPAGNETGKADAANALAQIKKETASGKADEQLEKDQTKATSDALQIVQTENACTTHKGRPIRVRTPALTTTSKATYDKIYREVAPFVQRLVAEMKALFEELREGSIDRGRICGRVDMKSLRRINTDSKIFSNKKNPIDIPDMVICLLLDQSGSMTGRRIHACEKAAILLEAFARMLDIPIMVCGHNTGGGGINFYVHRDYDTMDERRKYSLADIETDNSNRDGYAIYAASELLGKRQETDKILLIISDGQPADFGYGGEAAAKDIQQIVKNANRKYGIETIAAAIGDDRDRIKKIYGSGYLDISDLSKLPKALTKIIRERLEM